MAGYSSVSFSLEFGSFPFSFFRAIKWWEILNDWIFPSSSYCTWGAISRFRTETCLCGHQFKKLNNVYLILAVPAWKFSGLSMQKSIFFFFFFLHWSRVNQLTNDPVIANPFLLLLSRSLNCRLPGNYFFKSSS